MTREELLTRAEKLRALAEYQYREAFTWALLDKQRKAVRRLREVPIGLSTRMTRSAGLCTFRHGDTDRPRCEVKLSVPILTDPANAHEVDDTILHEFAHVLAGPGQGHNHVWRSVCRRIGARPRRTAKGMKWGVPITCTMCGKTVRFGTRQITKWRRGRAYGCPYCNSLIVPERRTDEQITHA